MQIISITYIKNVVVQDLDLEELRYLGVLLHVLFAGYTEMNYPYPDWMGEQARALKVELEIRTREEKLRQLKNMRNRREALKTADEKRRELDEQIAALEKELQ